MPKVLIYAHPLIALPSFPKLDDIFPLFDRVYLAHHIFAEVLVKTTLRR